ncbi:GDSL-type esterase/lipase family protein [Lachnospiraceae bacterium 54-53]
MTEYIFYQSGQRPDGAIRITPFDRLGRGTGAGFFTERSPGSSGQCALPELNSGFMASPWFQGETIVKQDTHGCYVDSQSIMSSPGISGDGRIPLSFQADLKAQGRFLLTLTLYAGEDEGEVLLFIGRRQLVWKGSLKAGEKWSGSFPFCVYDIIPRGKNTRYWDGSVAATVISRSVRISSLGIRKGSGRTVFVAGDSTVTDQSAEFPYAPGTSYGGWGQMLPAHLNGTMAVSNHAHSGLTTESFREEGHYEILLESISPGDICLFQFGHNDQKRKHLKAEEGYRKNLEAYVLEIRGKGAHPVLVTPLARNSWKGTDGTYNDLLREYGEAVKGLGKSLAVPVLDLHGRSMAFIKEHGLEDSKRWFYPSDYTHTNDYGAWKMAGFVWEELIKAGLLPSGQKKRPDWEPPEVFLTPPVSGHPSFVNIPPEGEVSVPDRPEDILTRAEALDLVIRAVRYFPTNVYNDLFSDVIGHEWYAGTIECALQNGLIPEQMEENGCFYPNRPITLEEFLWIAVTGYKSRNRLPEKTAGAAEESLPWAREAVGAACAMKAADPGDSFKRNMTRGEAAVILGRLGLRHDE